VTTKIGVIVHGPSQPLSLATCLDALLSQRRHLTQIEEIIVVLPANDIPLQNILADRQRKAPGVISALASTGNRARDLNVAIQLSRSQWLALLAADGTPPLDWLEKLWGQFRLAQQNAPLVVAIGAPSRFIDIGGFSQIQNMALTSAFQHFYDPRWWQPQVENQVDAISFDNALLQRSTLLRLLPLNEQYAEIGFETDFGLRLKDEGSQLMLFPQPVVMLRELGKPSAWFQRWRQLAMAQESLDREINPNWNLASSMAWLMGAIFILGLLALPFSNWLASLMLVYLLIMLNVGASIAFKNNEGKKTITITGWMIATHTQWVYGYVSCRSQYLWQKYWPKTCENLKRWSAPAARYLGALAARAKTLFVLGYKHCEALLGGNSPNPQRSTLDLPQLPNSHPANWPYRHEESNSKRFEIRSRPESSHPFVVGRDTLVPPSPHTPSAVDASAAQANHPSPPPT
jgi:glycosyltransferase involved in cell wall biosynthesis